MRMRVPVVGALSLSLAVALAGIDAAGQGRGRGQAPAPPQTARQAAPIDLVGTWVSVVTEDWRWRMVTPPKGDVASVPVSPEGRKTAQAWDPAADNASGNQCKAFGVGGIMRQPGRLRISWQDDETLKLEFDAGTQTRLLNFARAVGGSWRRTRWAAGRCPCDRRRHPVTRCAWRWRSGSSRWSAAAPAGGDQ